MAILRNTNFFKAFTTSSMIPAIYIQRFWNTMRYDSTTGTYNCQLDEQWFELHKEILRDALQIIPSNDNDPFVAPPSSDIVIEYVNTLGYLVRSRMYLQCQLMLSINHGEPLISTDISKITRKPSKTGKNGHENGRVYKSRKQSQEKSNPQSNSGQHGQPKNDTLAILSCAHFDPTAQDQALMIGWNEESGLAGACDASNDLEPSLSTYKKPLTTHTWRRILSSFF
ncbi:hypothetical protein Tco_1030487 [Tanacetum coccineum]|uniref:Uncharacterized protein n=1 Tax=Tanacetum coccineum TaxID=301880 RepID=A0ABQ5G6X7_9ASTR